MKKKLALKALDIQSFKTNNHQHVIVGGHATYADHTCGVCTQYQLCTYDAAAHCGGTGMECV